MNVDLRAKLEQVYNQGQANECSWFMCKTMLEVWRDQAGLPYREVSEKWIGRRGMHMTGQDNPELSNETLRRVLDIGFLYADQFNPDVPISSFDELATANGKVRLILDLPTPGNDVVQGFRRSLLMGLAVGYCQPVGPTYWDGWQGPWRGHTPMSGSMNTTHWLSAVGFADDVERGLSEDSSGPGAWDGGFLGMPYSLMREPGIIQWPLRIDHITTIPRTIPDLNEEPAPFLTSRMVGLWFDNNRHRLTADVVEKYLEHNPSAMWSKSRESFANCKHLLQGQGANALGANGVPGLLEWCRNNGITDLLLECLTDTLPPELRWKKNQVRRFFDANNLDPSLIEWAPL